MKIGNSSRLELIGIEANKPGRYLADKVADDIVIIFKDIILEKFWNYQVKQFHEILLRRVKFKIEAHRISGLLLLWTGYLHIFSTDSTFFFFFWEANSHYFHYFMYVNIQLRYIICSVLYNWEETNWHHENLLLAWPADTWAQIRNRNTMGQCHPTLRYLQHLMILSIRTEILNL